MKTKLLKKVRKRFSIEYFPNGRYIYGEFEKTPMVCLIDREDSDNFRYFYVLSRCPKEDAYSFAMKIMKELIIKEYSKYGTRRNKIRRQATDNGQKLWWK